jgi:hypothetical protein
LRKENVGNLDNRSLILDDIRHSCKVVTALSKNIEIQKDIESLCPEIEIEIIESNNPKKI